MKLRLVGASKQVGWRTEYPFASHWMQMPDGRMHFVDESTAEELAGPALPAGKKHSYRPVLLFVHGNPTWSFHWRRLVVALRSEYRCIAPDHLGCGLSGLQARPLSLADHVDNLRGLVQRLNLQNVTLVAQDWGGAIGLGALLEERERFDNVVLFNTGAFPPPRVPWRIRACRGSYVGRLLVQGANLFSLAALRMTLANTKRLATNVSTGYLAPYNSWNRRAAVYNFVRDIPMSSRHPTWKTLDKIESQLPELNDMPIQLIWGMRDWCFDSTCLEKFVSMWPNAKVRRLSNVGHWVVEDAPQKALAITTEFLTNVGGIDGRPAPSDSVSADVLHMNSIEPESE